MAKLSRDKGKIGERELGHLFASAKLPYLREQDGRTQGADFAIEQFRVEARRRNQLRIIAWSRELEDKTPDHLVPVLAYRPDREPWRVSMLATDWAGLVGEARS